MYRECHSLQLPILVDMLLLTLFFCSDVGGTARGQFHIGEHLMAKNNLQNSLK